MTAARDLAADVETWARSLAPVPAPPSPLTLGTAELLLREALYGPPVPELVLELVVARRRTHLAQQYADVALCGVELDTATPPRRGLAVTCRRCASRLPEEA